MAHHLTTGRFTKFHCNNKYGSFQTGKGEHVHLWLAHEVDQTGVVSSRQELVDAGFIATTDLTANAIEINGVNYAVDIVYDQAYIAQTNLDNLIERFSQFAAPVDIFVSDGIVQAGASNNTPTLGTVNTNIGGVDLLGTELAEAAGLVWKVELIFEQKGAFVRVPNLDQATFVRGEPSIAVTADNFGSSVQDIHDLLEGTVMYLGGLRAAGGDSENVVDMDTSALFFDGTDTGTNLITLVTGAFAGGLGDEAYIVTNNDPDEATSQSVVVEVIVKGDLQS